MNKFWLAEPVFAPADSQGGDAPASTTPAPRSGSIDDVAASLGVDAPSKDVEPRQKKQPAAQTRAEEALADDGRGESRDTDEGDDGEADTDSAEPEDEAEHAEPREEEDTDESESVDDDSEDFDTDDADDDNTLSDDYKVKVKVDGEEVETTLGELKKRFAGEGAIESRLQKVTETHRTAVQQLETNRQQITEIVAAVGELVFGAKYNKPDPALLQTDRDAYFYQKELYDADQTQIKERRDAVSAVMSEMQRRKAEYVEQVKEAEVNRLRQALPILSDPEKGPKIADAIHRNAMEHYGFTKEEIGSVLDHRMYLMAIDALKYRQSVSGKTKAKVVEKPIKGKTLKKAAQNRPQYTAQLAQARQQKAKLKRARETGRVEDVAEIF